MNNHYDTIIIGAGLGGLTAGAVLSSKKKKVLVIEQHSKVGGFATNFKRKDYIFDVSLHNFGTLYHNKSLLKIFNDLKLLDELKYIEFDEYQRLIFPDDDITIKKGVKNFVEELKNKFPKENQNIDKLFDLMQSLKEEFDEIEKLNISMDNLLEEFPLLPVKFPMLVRLVDTTLDEMVSQHITNERLKGIINSSWWLYGLPPKKVASILYVVSTMDFFNYSGGYIEGTSQKLSDTVASKIVNNNGTILTNTMVKEIITDNNRVKGVVTSNNDIYYSQHIISNINPKSTYLELLNFENKKVNDLELSLSAIQLYLGLDINPKSLGIPNHNLTVFYSYNHEENYIWIMDGEYKKTFFSATNYTDIDKSIIPDGKGVLNIMSLDHIKNWENLTKTEYLDKKERVSNIIIEKLEKYYKNISKHIIVKELATPLTMKRYTQTPRGSIYGFSQSVSQSGINRFSSNSNIEGLFFTGANTYPGAGYSSVMISGARMG